MQIAVIIIGVCLVIALLMLRPLIKIRRTSSTTGKPPEPHRPELTHNLYRHVEVLSREIGSRSLQEYGKMKQAQTYIETFLREAGIFYEIQDYKVNGKSYGNVVVTLPGKKNPPQTIVVGAHYDTIPNTPGADDNASAVSLLLEMCRSLRDYAPDNTIKLVFFTLEEPPVFDTRNMGSYVFAKDAKKRNEDIKLMICLEMIGYYNNREKGQEFPLPLMNLFYPTTPDFVLVIGDIASKSLTVLTGDKIRQASGLQVKTLTVPRFFPGIKLSDHSSFWKNGYRAIMITDTGFYRNPNYHNSKDTIDTLDFDKITALYEGMVKTVKDLSRKEDIN